MNKKFDPSVNFFIEGAAGVVTMILVGSLISMWRYGFYAFINNKVPQDPNLHWIVDLFILQIVPTITVLAVARYLNHPYKNIWQAERRPPFPWTSMLFITVGALLTSLAWHYATESLHPTNYVDPGYTVNAWDFFIKQVAYSTLAPAAEEILFRGVILQCAVLVFCQGKTSRSFLRILMAVLVASFIFAKMHGEAFPFWPQFLAGIIFSVAFLRSGQLWIPILLHCLWNGLIQLYILKISYVNAWLYQLGVKKLICTFDFRTWQELLFALLIVYALLAFYLVWKPESITLPSD